MSDHLNAVAVRRSLAAMKGSYKRVLACCALAGLWAFATAAVGQALDNTADTQMPNFYSEPGIFPARDYVNQHFGEFIDPFSGKLQHHYTDILLPGNGGFDLKVQRSYTSVEQSPSTEPNPAGLGWTIHFGRVLVTNTACQESQWPTIRKAPVLELPDGSRQLFATWNQDASGQTLVSANRWKAVCRTGSQGYVVTSPEGVQYEMTQVKTITGGPFPVYAWHATKITDKKGNTATITYDTQTPIGAVVSGVSTNDGRTLTFGYTNPGNGKYQLTSIASNTSPAQTCQYQYQNDQSGGSSHFFLTRVVRPDGATWAYDYHYSYGTGRYSMRSVIFPQGGLISYTYALQSFLGINATVIATKTTSDGQWAFAYAPGSGGTNDRTTVTAPDGTTVYDHVGANTVSNGSVWKIGLLVSKTRSSGGTAETESYTWQGQAISAQDNSRLELAAGASPTDADFNAPLLTQRTVTREGTSYTTTYSGYDQFGNPGTVTEVGNGSGARRAVTYGYCINTGKWLLRPVASESISFNGGYVGAISRTYDATCTDLQQENRFGAVTSFTYHTSGELASRTDARGYSTQYANYQRGIAQSETHPEAVSIARTVSAAGTVTSETNGEGYTRSYQYDALNRLTAIDHPAGNDVTISWTATTRTVTRGNYRQVTTFDGYGRVLRVSAGDAAGTPVVVTFEYDALGRRTFQSHPSYGSPTTAGTRNTYDVLGRIKTLRHVDAAGSTLATRSFSYGGNNVTTVTDERGYVTNRGYRSFGNPDERALMSVTPPAGINANLSIARNVFGQITQVDQGVAGVAPGVLSRIHGYDSRFFLTSVSDPETGQTVFGRDAVGNMTSRTVGASGPTTFRYDGRNRLTAIEYPEASRNVTQAWNKNDKLREAANGAATRTRSYDANDNLLTDTLRFADGQSLIVGYAYDGNDQLSQITYPRGGSTVGYVPDALGRPTAALPFATSVSHHASGQISAITFANGVTTTFGQDNRLRPSSILSSKGGANFVNVTYGYDAASNVTSITDAANATNNRTLGYDGIDRLSSVNGNTLTYDGVGNLRSQSFSGVLGSGTLSYTYDAQNRLASTSGTSSRFFGYDSYGNVTGNGVHTFRYNDASHLTHIDFGTAAQVDFDHDANGLRVLKRKGGMSTYRLHAPDGSPLLELDPSGNTRQEHIYLGGQRIASKSGSAYYTAAVALQSSAARTEPGQAVVLTATVWGANPAGTVSFYDRGSQLGAADLANGVASVSSGALKFGVHSFTAVYGGDSGNTAAASGEVRVQSGNVPAAIEPLKALLMEGY